MALVLIVRNIFKMAHYKDFRLNGAAYIERPLPCRSNAAAGGILAEYGYYIPGFKDDAFFKTISNPDTQTCPIFRVLPKSALNLMQ